MAHLSYCGRTRSHLSFRSRSFCYWSFHCRLPHAPGVSLTGDFWAAAPARLGGQRFVHWMPYRSRIQTRPHLPPNENRDTAARRGERSRPGLERAIMNQTGHRSTATGAALHPEWQSVFHENECSALQVCPIAATAEGRRLSIEELTTETKTRLDSPTGNRLKKNLPRPLTPYLGTGFTLEVLSEPARRR